MNREQDVMDVGLQSRVQQLADAFERSAPGEEQVTTIVQARLDASARRRVVGTMVLAVAAVAVLAFGVRAATQAPVGAPMPMPNVVGVFVTTQPDADGQCLAVRLYDTTPQDGRAAIFAWTGVTGCADRKGNISSSLGQASGLRLASGAGVAVDASAGAPKDLEGLHLVLEVGDGSAGELTAYSSVDGAVEGTGGRTLEKVERLDIPYHAK